MQPSPIDGLSCKGLPRRLNRTSGQHPPTAGMSQDNVRSGQGMRPKPPHLHFDRLMEAVTTQGGGNLASPPSSVAPPRCCEQLQQDAATVRPGQRSAPGRQTAATGAEKSSSETRELDSREQVREGPERAMTRVAPTGGSETGETRPSAHVHPPRRGKSWRLLSASCRRSRTRCSTATGNP